MDGLSFLKFWKTSSHEVNEEEEEEDSLFELEIISMNNYKDQEDDRHQDASSLKNELSTIGRRILPIEPTTSKPPPPSPISILKSAPKFKVSLFKKPKMEQPRKEDRSNSAKESPFFSKLSRDSSARMSDPNMRKKQSGGIEETVPQFDDSSKRFAKDVLHKYLKIVKPFHAKGCSREKVKLSDRISAESPPRPPERSNSITGFKVVCRHLGKSRSASAAMNPATMSRRDDSLLQQDDGIQSAILHCKRSFTSSRLEKNHPCYVSRVSCDPTEEKSLEDQMRISIEEEEEEEEEEKKLQEEGICMLEL